MHRFRKVFVLVSLALSGSGVSQGAAAEISAACPTGLHAANVYAAINSLLERAMQLALKEIPNGTPAELKDAFAHYLDSLMPDALKDPRVKARLTKAFAAIGQRDFTDGQMAACFPSLAPLSQSQEELLEYKQLQAQQQAKLGYDPQNVLGNSYQAYSEVKRCYEARAGYTAVYITDLEMEQAKNAVGQIEDAMKSGLAPGMTTDKLWLRVLRWNFRPFDPSRDYRKEHRKLCRAPFDFLLSTLRERVPESRRIEKDF